MSSWSPASGGWSNYIPSKQGVAKTVSGIGGVATGVYGAVSNSVLYVIYTRITILMHIAAGVAIYMFVARVPNHSRSVTFSATDQVPSGQGYLSSLPAGLKRLSDLLPTSDNSEHGVGDRDEVVTVAFDVDTGPAKHLHFLNVCFRNGFQVWEVLDSDEHGTQATRETQPLREVVSVRQGYTQIVKILSTVEVAPESPLHEKQPAAAIVAGDEPGDLNVVRLFSLAENDYVHHMRFHGDVHAVSCNRHWMIVSLKNQLIIHRISDMTSIQTLTTFPSPTWQGVVALGARWLAYASNQPLRTDPDDECNTDPYNTYGSAYLDIGVAAASTAASSAMHLGGLGLRTLNSYLGSSPPIPTQASDLQSEYAGTIMVRDLHTQSVVHHFKAHEGPVSIVRFDPSGLLLATAAVDGHNINVFQVDASHLHAKTKSAVPRAPRHLYKLVRGMTSAIIDDLSFSPDTRWISVTTRSRTSHLYAINGDGSHATVETHVPSPSIDAAWPLYPSSASYAASTNAPITLFAVQRIKQREHLPASVVSRTLAANNKGVGVGALSSSCTRFAIPGNNSSFSQFPAAAGGIFMVTGEGVGVVMASYQLSPFCKEDPDTLAQTLYLDVDCQGTMDICRRRSWREQECNAQRLSSWTKAAKDNAKAVHDCNGMVMPEWVSNVEIYTHERGEDAVWGSKNFRFKSFKKGDVPPASGPPAFIEQVETVAVGGRCAEMDGEADPDLEDYCFVQGPGPRTGPTVSPHVWPTCAPPAPDVLHLHLPDNSPGVYGGVPASYGSSQGTPPIHENRAHGQGCEPAGAGSYGSGGGKVGVSGGGYGCRGDSTDEENCKGGKALPDELEQEEGLFEMDLSTPSVKDDADWDSDGDWEAGDGRLRKAAAGGGKLQVGSGPGLAASTMLFDDDDLEADQEFFSCGGDDVKNASRQSGSPRDEKESASSSASRQKNAIEIRQPAGAPRNEHGSKSAREAARARGIDEFAGETHSWEQEDGEEGADDKGSSSEEAGSAWDEKYDGDGSAKGDNDTPGNSFSPCRAQEMLANLKKLHVQLQPCQAGGGDDSPGDYGDDAWGEPVAAASLLSPTKPAAKIVGLGLQAATPDDSTGAASDKDNSASAPESSDIEGRSSGMESGERESASETAASSAKKKKKKKSKK